MVQHTNVPWNGPPVSWERSGHSTGIALHSLQRFPLHSSSPGHLMCRQEPHSLGTGTLLRNDVLSSIIQIQYVFYCIFTSSVLKNKCMQYVELLKSDKMILIFQVPTHTSIFSVVYTIYIQWLICIRICSHCVWAFHLEYIFGRFPYVYLWRKTVIIPNRHTVALVVHKTHCKEMYILWYTFFNCIPLYWKTYSTTLYHTAEKR